MTRSRNEERQDARLKTAWLETPTPAPASLAGTRVGREAPSLGAADGGPVLVMVGHDGHAAATREALLQPRPKGARLYVLVAPDWGAAAADAPLRQNPQALVRRVTEVPASAVIAGAVAWVGLGHGPILRLDAAQAAALRQVFLRLFWHEATEEAWYDGAGFVWRAARPRPFDVPNPLPTAPVRLEAPGPPVGWDTARALVHITAGPPPQAVPRRLWFPAGPEHHGRLAKLSAAGCAVVWAERGLPDLVVSEVGGAARLAGSHAQLCLTLSREQARDVAALLEPAAPWHFATDVRLRHVAEQATRVWLPGAAVAAPLVALERVPAGQVAAPSLRAMTESLPPSWPPPHPLALSVRYEWTVAPPRLPEKTVEDPLIGRYRELDQDWQARCDAVGEALSAFARDEGRIGKTFARLAQALLGFKRKHDELHGQLATLSAHRPSLAGPEGAAALFEQLARLEAEAKALCGAVTEAEQKAREDAERERQQNDWAKGVEAAKKDLGERRETRDATTARREECRAELAAAHEAMKTADAATKKDLKVRVNKLKDDIYRAEKEQKRLEADITALEAKVLAPFEFRRPAPPAKPKPPASGRFVPPPARKTQPVVVPEEALPAVGALRCQKTERYLVITRWEDLAAGEAAASRLHAHLVAPEE